jgi:hypothetical protein
MLSATLCAGSALWGQAHAADATEFWPEISAYVALQPATRVYLDASYTRDKAAEARSLELSAFLDLSIQPILREELRTEDWQRGRYFWARLGYTHVAKATDGIRAAAEDRGVVSLYAKALLPSEVVLEGRARADLRWIGGDYSTRYRLRLEMNREFTVREHSVVPYAHAEVFYDTRYDAWARALYQMGTEITASKGFRYELYLARQNDRRPHDETLNSLGLVGKWYF